MALRAEVVAMEISFHPICLLRVREHEAKNDSDKRERSESLHCDHKGEPSVWNRLCIPSVERLHLHCEEFRVESQP